MQRTDLLVIFGANPFVSNGSVLSIPRVRDRLREIEARGGRVVVIDPRRTETAREFDHVPILPDGDARLLLSLLHVIFEEDLVDYRRSGAGAGGRRACRARARLSAGGDRGGYGGRSGARPIARARDRDGSLRRHLRANRVLPRPHGTLTAFLLDAARRRHRQPGPPGRARFGAPPLDLEGIAEKNGLATYGERRSRIGGFPDVLGQMPATLMAPEIETRGRASCAR